MTEAPTKPGTPELPPNPAVSERCSAQAVRCGHAGEDDGGPVTHRWLVMRGGSGKTKHARASRSAFVARGADLPDSVAQFTTRAAGDEVRRVGGSWSVADAGRARRRCSRSIVPWSGEFSQRRGTIMREYAGQIGLAHALRFTTGTDQPI